eukprot:TRINITY_DN19027_c0_g1_i1.p1 TRINITY_DN19027_c0_g1~~TRINITY_DN19027_c0_g1_i1.p1  ORF type:complete len:288 (+),score=48.82 TRINITY_DN19027_c0_g1_i1:96-959(+)
MAADAAAQQPHHGMHSGGPATGMGMAVFVHVPGLPDALCIELPSDATVADLRRAAQEQSGGRPVGRLRFAGELLADSAALADAGIGPQAKVDTEAVVSLTLVEICTMNCAGTSYRAVDCILPVSALEGLRLTGEAPPQAHKFFHPALPEGQVPLWVDDAPAGAAEYGIEAGMLVQLLQPGEANMELQRILADPQFQRDGVRCIATDVPPAVTVAVSPETTLENALLQASGEEGFTLEQELEDRYDFFMITGESHELLSGTMRCDAVSTMLPEGACVGWHNVVADRFE